MRSIEPGISRFRVRRCRDALSDKRYALARGMTAKKPSGGDRQDRLWLGLLPMAAQFSRDFGVQHLFQPGQGLGHQGGVGNAVIPADHDVDGLVLHHAIAEDEWPRAQRMEFAGAIGGNRGYPEAAEPVGTLRSEEHTSELQSHVNLVCRLLLEKKKKKKNNHNLDKKKK